MLIYAANTFTITTYNCYIILYCIGIVQNDNNNFFRNKLIQQPMKVHAKLFAIFYVILYVYKLRETFISRSHRGRFRRRTDISLILTGMLRPKTWTLRNARANGRRKCVSETFVDITRILNSKYPTWVTYEWRIIFTWHELDDSRRTNKCVQTEISL